MAEESEDSSGEKKHAASARKEQRARDDGNVARAPDLIKLVLMGVFFLIALIPGSAFVRWMFRWAPDLLAHAGTMTPQAALGFAASSFGVLSAMLIGLGVFGALAGMFPGGWSVSAKPVTPDFNRLSPAKGIKNLFSPKRLTETLKAALKFLVVGGAGLLAFLLWKERILRLAHTAAPNWTLGLEGVIWILGVCVVAAAGIVSLDTPLQAWFHGRELRMTDKELRDENKEMEINPQVRRRIRQAQARAARARMMEQVPQASAVVVNPAHYAVALRYRRHQDQAPVLIAAGTGKLAQRIRSVASSRGIPIVSAPPLARALYYHGTPGETIPTALYQACAEVMAYVWRLHLWASGQGTAPLPPAPDALAVDPRLDPLARHVRKINE